MPIQTPHPEYAAHVAKVKKTRDAYEGEVYDYIQRLRDQDQYEYESYRQRASYYNVVERTVGALVGALMRKPFSLEGVVGDEPVCCDDCDFEEFVQKAYVNLMLGGRIGVMCDYSSDWDTPYLLSYSTEDITNWSETMVVLRECYYAPAPSDPYTTIERCRYRELFLDENGYYTVRIWEQKTNSKGQIMMGSNAKWEVTEVIEPTYRGQRLEYIPFVFVTPYDTSCDLNKPPMYTIADINLDHFKLAVDIAHGAHFMCLPTPVIAGDLASDNQKLAIGGSTVWHLTQGSSAQFLEVSGAGLNQLLDMQKQKETQMFSLGSRLLQYKAGVESSDALQIRLGAEGASLTTIANALEQGLTKVLDMYNAWYGYTDGEVVLNLNKDFSPAMMGADEIRVLIEAYQQGAITLETLLQRLYEGEIVDSVEVERAGLSKSA